MFDCLAVGVYPVNADAGNPCVFRVVIEEIQKVYACPCIFADGDDALGFVRPNTDRQLAEEKRRTAWTTLVIPMLPFVAADREAIL
jgi:hypothetical protein